MKSKVLNFLLIVSSLLGYLEWGGGNHIFLFQAEAEIVPTILADPLSVLHPFIMMPLVGQILLLITLFQKTPSKILTFIGIASVGLLLAFMFIIGLIGVNFKILLSTIPFLTLAVWTVLNLAKSKRT